MIVVDTNVIVHYWLKSALNDNAERLLKKDPHWIAPFLWRSEFRSVLSLYIKKKMLTIEQAESIIDFTEKQFRGNEYLIDSKSVLRLSDETGCSTYGCEFVFLANEFSTKLYTTDKQLLKSFPRTAVDLKMI